MDFRVHHILCTSLYQGYGYSGAFCENMTRIVNDLRENMDEPMRLVTNPDMICENCPNLIKKDQSCAGDSNHVHLKDLGLLDVLELTENELYTYRYLLLQGSMKITREVFEDSCCNCQWYRQGLCRYELFASNVNKLLGL